jgi:uncharacterized membrane protein YgcG
MLAGILAASLLLAGLLTSPAFGQEVELPERRGDREIRVYDTAGILTDGEESGLQSDLVRASRLGLEMLVYTRMSSDSDETAQQFADALREQWGVTTGPEADDGIVFLLNVSPGDPEANDVYISKGEHALPIRQLDEATFEHIVDDEMRPAVANGEFTTALYYGVRRVLNYAEYSPPDPEPLSSTQRQFGMLGRIAGAVTAQLAIIGYILVPIMTQGRLSPWLSRRALTWYALVVGGLGIAIGLIGIIGRDAFASLTGLAAVTWAGAGVPLLASWIAPGEDDSSNEAGPARHAHG